MSVSDEDLLTRWTELHDAEAFREVASRYSGMVYATCKRILGDATEAEDVAQECFEVLARKGRKAGTYVGAWLHKVATNHCLMRLRAEKRRRDREMRFAAERNSAGNERWDDIYSFVDEAIANLPDKLRVPVVLHFFENQTHDAIAETIGTSRQTVTYRIEKAIGAIRKSLKKQGVPVATSALATLMAANLAEAAPVPVSLATALGKLAIAGSGSSAAAAAAGSGAGLLSKLIVRGGIVVTTKKIVIGLGALLVLSVLTYSLVNWSQRYRAEQEDGAVLSAPASDRKDPAVLTEHEPRRLVQEQGFTPVSAEPVRKEEGIAVSEEQEEPQAAFISGSVLDDQQYPLEDADLELRIVADPPFGNDILATYGAKSSSDGKYEIKGIDTFGYAIVQASSVTAYPCIQRLRVIPGMERNDVNFTLQEAAFFIAGRVVSETRRPIPGASVNLMSHSRGGTSYGRCAFVTTDTNGYFEMAIPYEGLCDFSVTKHGYAMGFFPGVSTGTYDALFVLPSPGAVAGRITWTSGEPAEGAVVEVLGRTSGENNLSIFPCHVVTVTDERGDYTVENLSEDLSYTVVAHAPGSGRAGTAISMTEDDVNRHIRSIILNTEGRASVQEDVRVSAGRTTYGVDLVIAMPVATRIYGRVTDAESGVPIHPLTVTASGIDSGTFHRTEAEPDGSYSLTFEIGERTTFCIGCEYKLVGGLLPVDIEENAIQIVPGEEKRFDFNAPGPITVPARFVYSDGSPRNDLEAWVRFGGTSWGIGEVGSDGSIVLSGLPPGVTLQVLGRTQPEGVEVGASEPFAGQPGETLPEITIFCPSHGGIEGMIVDERGNPVSHASLRFTTLFQDGRTSPIHTGATDANGAFCIWDALPEGVHPKVFVGRRTEDGLEMGVVENVEIATGAVTHLGTIRLDQQFQSIEEAEEQLLGIE